MKLLLDENLSPAQAADLRDKGYDAVSVAQLGLCGADDSVIRQAAIDQNRILVTLDGDFANFLRFPPTDTPGVLRLRVHPPTESSVASVLSDCIPRLEGLELRGKLIVVDGRGIRIRG